MYRDFKHFIDNSPRSIRHELVVDASYTLGVINLTRKEPEMQFFHCRYNGMEDKQHVFERIVASVGPKTGWDDVGYTFLGFRKGLFDDDIRRYESGLYLVWIEDGDVTNRHGGGRKSRKKRKKAKKRNSKKS